MADLAVQHPDPIFLHASSADEMQRSQSSLGQWLRLKENACRAETTDLSSALENARKHKWQTSALTRAVASSKRRASFYEKLAIAVEAGHTLIPAMGWVDVFAVRKAKAFSDRTGSQTNYREHAAIPQQLSDSPPAGEGQYVSSDSAGYIDSFKENIPGKEAITKYCGISTDYKEVEFPVAAAKPELMHSTAQAMALKVFDEIGIVPNRRGRDPFIVGTIAGPNGRRQHFIIAWYLDTRAL